jgi:hypothetical protein
MLDAAVKVHAIIFLIFLCSWRHSLRFSNHNDDKDKGDKNLV